jgi:pimeloyl-[acyl-carrier protein] methyl ester esterase
MIKLIFCHGWGFNKYFFAKLAALLAEFPSILLDSGYFSPKNIAKIMPENHEDYYIGIGHSLGFAEILAMPIKWHALVSISSFGEFIENKNDKVALLSMIRKFKNRPEIVLKDFYKKCGLSADDLAQFMLHNSAGLDQEFLLQDLKRLISLNIKDKIAELSCPVLVLHALDDQIVNGPKIISGFSNGRYFFCNKGGHALGFKRAEFCWEKIKEFLSEVLP